MVLAYWGLMQSMNVLAPYFSELGHNLINYPKKSPNQHVWELNMEPCSWEQGVRILLMGWPVFICHQIWAIFSSLMQKYFGRIILRDQLIARANIFVLEGRGVKYLPIETKLFFYGHRFLSILLKIVGSRSLMIGWNCH